MGPLGSALWRHKVTALITLAAGLASAGCTTDFIVRMGVRMDPAALESRLRVGESTRADVLTQLGPPTSKSRVMLPTDPQPKEMWTYYYRENTRQDSWQQYVFVTFDGDRLDGYSWFSTFPTSR